MLPQAMILQKFVRPRSADTGCQIASAQNDGKLSRGTINLSQLLRIALMDSQGLGIIPQPYAGTLKVNEKA